MNAIGIIAEYNPFHNGHLYHINKIKEKYPDSTIVLILAGNFTQRGDVSVIDKWKKTDIALNYGVDLVVELPFPFATQSADYFSYGSVTLLEKLKVNKLIFGSESDNIDDLKLIANLQVSNDEFDKLVKIYSKFGKNYPTAVSSAIMDLCGKKIDTPNDLLGISYIKEIIKNNYNIDVETIKRTNDYHDNEIKDEVTSATSIRLSLKNGLDSVSKAVPDYVLNKLDNLHFIEDYFDILKYKLITENDLDKYQTVSEGIDNSLKKEIINSNSYYDFVMKIKSKRYTYNKICRMLLHILCNFTKEKANQFNKITYIRILGLNNKGRCYLNSVKKEIDIPIISKIERDKDKMLEFEIETTKIYDIVSNCNLTKREFERIIYKGEDEND